MTAVHAVPERPVARAAGDRGEPGADPYEHLVPVVAEFAALAADDPRRPVLRDQLVAGFLPVVRHVALRYRNRGEPVEDLEQVGTIGLLNALDRFAPERGSDFLSYAVPTITGEVRRHFRDKAWSMRVPRALKDLQKPVRDAVEVLSEELQRAPRPSEIAARLGIGVEEVIEALRAQEAYNAVSLDTPLGVGDGDATLSDTFGWVDTALQKVEYRHALRPLLEQLPARERTILVLRFFGDLTQTQIAAQVGLSQMHVSRVLTQTLARLRRQLDAD